MASTLIKLDLPVIDLIWVDDPPPGGAPGDFYDNEGGGRGSGVRLPGGTATEYWVIHTLLNGGLRTSEYNPSPPNKPIIGFWSGYGELTISTNDTYTENGELVRETTYQSKKLNNDGTVTSTTLVVTFRGRPNSDGSYSGNNAVTVVSRTTTDPI